MPLPYKVFLVEDEIVTRDAIRNNVNWAAAGFEYGGEAPDGEMALPLILASRPDVLITDIKMPFLDGLELSQLVRQSLPDIQIIILSGYDEFQYAQQAIKLGVTEYLLKPVGAQELEIALGKIAVQIERKRWEQEQINGLKHQVADSLTMQREKFLRHLLVDGLPTRDAIERGRQLGIDLVSQVYLVMFLQARDSRGGSGAAAYAEFPKVEQIVVGLVEQNSELIFIKKDIDEFVVILKNREVEQARQDAYYLAETIREQVGISSGCSLGIGLSQPFERLGELVHFYAFAEENARLEGAELALESGDTPTALLQVDDDAVLQYLKFGDGSGFDYFFEESIAQAGKAQSRIFMDYIVINTTLATARYIRDIGGDPRQILPELENFETLPPRIRNIQDACQHIRNVTQAAIHFRDRQANRQSAALIHKTKDYLDAHFSNAELSLNDVSLHIGLSANHLSFIFKRETGETFKDYLTHLRVERAKELLRSTGMSAAEISEHVGYNDPHYFSVVFKKVTGMRPSDFRSPKGRTS